MMHTMVILWMHTIAGLLHVYISSPWHSAVINFTWTAALMFRKLHSMEGYRPEQTLQSNTFWVPVIIQCFWYMVMYNFQNDNIPYLGFNFVVNLNSCGKVIINLLNLPISVTGRICWVLLKVYIIYK